ncbi:glycosyltransferase involved in cell wall biosynthesis [Paenibacillus sp. BK033]|uniref:glycosyltransferase family 4 protein n=1 Tax=Paenibacillus sp. BK033 TaxID=2512133 RepID=UPI00104AA012|nr:glycosyltransferase family 1 protein [Paenibacillus sp. BK033]TCM98964.1 glycosyltransferase involved in cell wall biosynthesis [Paenibacillus sp. BK033]
MNILIWSNQFSIGGGMRLLFNLTAAIARQPGVERVRLVVAPDSQLRNYVELQKTGNIEICYNSNPINHPQSSHLLANMNVVYFFWPHTEQFQFIDRPTVCTFHDTTIFDFVPPFMKGEELSFHWRLSKKWIDHTASVVVSSQHVKNRLIAHFGSRSEQAFVIPHAITPIANVYNRKVSPELSSRIPADYIIYPSNTSPHKNHNNLLVGFAKSRYKRKYPLVLTGYLTDKLRIPFPDSTSEVSWIPTLVSTMKRTGLLLDRQVYPLGFVGDHDIPALIKNAKALIMPSLSEGGGSYPVEEALRLGTPVLCSDIPVMREHLSRHSAKIAWFDPHNPDSIAKALDDLFDDYDTYKLSALHGVHDATQTWDDIAKQYIEVFRITFWRYYGKTLY